MTLSEVCRKHSVSSALVYQWRAVAQPATTVALQQIYSRGKNQPDAQTAPLMAELERMRRVVAEITAENLELKWNSKAVRKSPVERSVETGSVGLVADSKINTAGEMLLMKFHAGPTK